MLINIVKYNAMLLVYFRKVTIFLHKHYPYVLIFLSSCYTDEVYINEV